MNAVEIEAAVSALALQPFDGAEFPFAFLTAFGNKETTIKRLRKGETNASDLPRGVLQRNNIHVAVCEPGLVGDTLKALRESVRTTSARAKFVLATDGQTLEAEDLASGETIASTYGDLADHFGFFLPLAGISTIKEIKDNPIDVRATGRLNKLYVELLKDNPEWATEARQPDMNHFMARIIFCFFAEDTDIFNGQGLFTRTVDRMSERDSSNTHEVISAVFRAMNTRPVDRAAAGLPTWINQFPYVNGGLFSGNTEVPRFSKMAKTYLMHAGGLSWREINPDIFGSMIQAVADDDERSALGMHYTSVPNILKVLNPLFLDHLNAQLEAAGDNARMLLNLRKRMARIRVFDPACGSGNFLVIAYKRMRAIEAEINRRRSEPQLRTEIPLTNFRGIELRTFPAEIARLALIIAEYQCDVLYRGQKEALAEFLPLDAVNWITCGNALRLDWISLCPPTGDAAKVVADDLFEAPINQAEIDFANEGGETYICGNPPFSGTRKQTDEQKRDLEVVFSGLTNKWKNVDYVGAWLVKAARYNQQCCARFAFVATNSLCQGQQVPITWAVLAELGCRIRFAHHSFTWANLARNRAGVTVVVVGLDSSDSGERALYTGESRRVVAHINPYLTEHKISIIEASRRPMFIDVPMDYGVYYSKSAGLILEPSEKAELLRQGLPAEFVRRFLGSTEFINGIERYCLWLDEHTVEEARRNPSVHERIESVRRDRLETDDAAVNRLAARPYQFRERKGDGQFKIFIPIVSSENREYFPVGVADKNVIPTNKAFFMAGAPLWCLSILSSRLHLNWIAAVCGRLRTDFSYSNTLGWNTFPVPPLTEQNKNDLSVGAEDILLAREVHFPTTIADLYDPDSMPDNLHHAHERNDEILERIYIGRRFRNDTERLEKLFDLYMKMTAAQAAARKDGRASQ